MHGIPWLFHVRNSVYLYLEQFWTALHSNRQRKSAELKRLTKSLVSSLKTVSFSERMRRGRRRRRRSWGRRRRIWTSRGRRMRSLRIGLWSHPCPVNKGSLVLPAYQETILQPILSVFVVVTKFYDLGITVLLSFNPIVYCMWKWNFCMTLLYAYMYVNIICKVLF